MYGGCHGLRKSFAQLLKIRREELWTVQEVQVSLLAPVEQKQRAVQEVDNDAVAGNHTTKTARRLEQELELESLGVEPIKKAEHITIESAADCIWATWLRGIYYQKGGRA